MFNRDPFSGDPLFPGEMGLTGGVNRQHVAVAMTAAILSLSLHAVFLYFVSGLELGMTGTANMSAKQKEPRRTVQLRDIDIPELASTKASSQTRGASGITRDLAKEIEILQKAPNEGLMQPPAATGIALAGSDVATVAPSVIPKRANWQPRQEIVAISSELVVDAIPVLERRRIAQIERIPDAADYVPAVDWEDVAKLAPGVPGKTVVDVAPAGAAIEVVEVVAPSSMDSAKVVINEADADRGAQLFEETPGEVTSVKAVERLLEADLHTYSSRWDKDYSYFRVDIRRIGAEVLPVIPKDVVLVQDCSASMAEQRLYFCREGLRRCLARIGPDDRFNVIAFRETGERCFPTWASNNLDNIMKAEGFIDAMRSGGKTDIYASVKDVLSLERRAGRPLVAIVVTDGLANTGLTGSSDIIGQFSKANDGSVSVFAMGTIQRANGYLLDLLSFCNRGSSSIVTSGRWDIPTALDALMVEVGRPVLSDVQFRFSSDSGCEVYPVQTENLYLDRSLVVYGRYPVGMERMAFQAIGEAENVVCDMIFDLAPATDGQPGDADLRTEWASQKIYHLIGQYARAPNPDLMREIKDTAKKYNVKIPYQGMF